VEVAILNKKRKKVIQQTKSTSKPNSLWLVFDFSMQMIMGSQTGNRCYSFLFLILSHLKKEPVAAATTPELAIHGHCDLFNHQYKLFERMKFSDVDLSSEDASFPATNPF
jgi:hypothetical protein